MPPRVQLRYNLNNHISIYRFYLFISIVFKITRVIKLEK